MRRAWWPALLVAYGLSGCADTAEPPSVPMTPLEPTPGEPASPPTGAENVPGEPSARQMIFDEGIVFRFFLSDDRAEAAMTVPATTSALVVALNQTSLYADPYVLRAPGSSKNPVLFFVDPTGNETQIKLEELLGYATSAGQHLAGPYEDLVAATVPGNWTVGVAGNGFNVRADIRVVAQLSAPIPASG